MTESNPTTFEVFTLVAAIDFEVNPVVAFDFEVNLVFSDTLSYFFYCGSCRVNLRWKILVAFKKFCRPLVAQNC